MATDLLVPDIGDFEDVPVIDVLVSVGDTVRKEDPLVTLESDKATMDVPSEHAGVIEEILVKVGDKVSKGAKVGRLRPEGAGTEAAPAPAQPPALEKEAPMKTAAPGGGPQAAVDLLVPDIGDFSDVPVIDVIAKAGDRLAKDDPLVTLESDKATMDVPSEHAGVVEEIVLKVGDKVSKGARVGRLRLEGAPAQAAPAAAPAPAPSPAPAKEAPAPAAPAAPPAPAASAAGNGKAAVYASPSVRKIAREFGVDLSQVPGSGRKGRILKEDVQSHVRTRLSAAPAAPGAASGTGLSLPEPPEIDFSKFGEVETRPLPRIKRISGDNLRRNWVVAPHVTQFEEADITDLEQFRKSLSAGAGGKGVKVTPLPFLVKAAVAALKDYPVFNTSLTPDGTGLVQKRYHHIGVAVNTDGGLVVPVIRDADRKGIVEIARELGELTEKARARKIRPEDMQGGTFTISSLGSIGGTMFTPIINLPEVAILGVSRSRMQPRWDGETFKPRLILPLSLSYDHRVIDGVAAALFAGRLADVLSDIRQMAL